MFSITIFFLGRFSAHFPQTTGEEPRFQDSPVTPGVSPPAIEAAEEPMIKGDPNNFPYQKYVNAQLDQLSAGNLYGVERQAAIDLLRKYNSECKAAGVKMFTYLNAEEIEFFKEIFQDPTKYKEKYKELRPEEWKEFARKFNVFRSVEFKDTAMREHLNQKYVAFHTKEPVAAVRADWDNVRVAYMKKQHDVDYEVSEVGLFQMIADSLKTEGD